VQMRPDDTGTSLAASAASAAPAIRPSWLAESWPPLLLTTIAYLVIAFFLLRAFDFNPSGPIRIGGFLPAAEQFWTPGTRVDRDGVGYDGQWFFYIAHDPLLREPDPASFLDLPAYRYARILYPTLAWAAALGQPAALPWALLGVNLLAVILGTAATFDILRTVGGNRWLALVYGFSPPVLIGMLATLAEPTSFALVMGGIALALRRRHALAGLTLALAVLAREPAILVPIGLGLYALGRLNWRRAFRYLAPLALPLSWHLSIWYRLGSLPSAQSPTNFGAPLGGAFYRLGLLLGWHPPMLGEPVPSGNVFTEAAIIVTCIGIIGIGLTKVLQRRDAFAWLLFLQALLAVCTGPLVWADLYSYGRVLGLLFICYGLMLLTSPQRRTSAWANRIDWTIDVPDWTILRKQVGRPVTLASKLALSTLKRQEHPS
jgi:hypothetical protein